MTEVRKGQAPGKLRREEFGERFRQLFVDPSFEAERAALGRIEEIAWRNFDAGHKAPITRKAGPGYADPDYDLSVDWLRARDRIAQAQARWADPASPTRALVICGSPRNDGTCPGEISKTFRLAAPGAGRPRRRADRGRLPRPEPAHLRVRPQDPPVQGLRVDGDAALPLAVQLLPEPLARPDPRLDERDLRALGGARTRSSSSRRRTGTTRPAR